MTDRRRRRRRVLVPFEVGSFLKAPYGYTVRMRAEEREGVRADQPPPPRTSSRREDALVGVVAVLCLCGIVAGGVVGWVESGSAVGVLIGVGLATAGVLALLLVLSLLVLVAVTATRRL